MSREVERYFSRTAERFDSLYELPVAQRLFNRLFRRAIYERFDLALMHAGDINGKRVLDIGCGSGRYAIEFARRGASEVVGVDFAADMLEIARASTAKAGLQDRVRFERAHFSDYVSQEPFDIALAIGFFDYIETPDVVLAHARRLTSGRLLASFPGGSFPRAHVRRWRYARHGVALRFYGRAEVAQLAREAGFARVEVLPLSAGHFLVADASS